MNHQSISDITQRVDILLASAQKTLKEMSKTEVSSTKRLLNVLQYDLDRREKYGYNQSTKVKDNLRAKIGALRIGCFI